MKNLIIVASLSFHFIFIIFFFFSFLFSHPKNDNKIKIKIYKFFFKNIMFVSQTWKKKRKKKALFFLGNIINIFFCSCFTKQNKNKKKENEVGWKGLGLMRGKKIDWKVKKNFPTEFSFIHKRNPKQSKWGWCIFPMIYGRYLPGRKSGGGGPGLLGKWALELSLK